MKEANKPDHLPSGREDAGSQEHAKDCGTRRGRGYRGKPPYNNKNKSRNKADAISAPKEKFTGQCDNLEGYFYSVTVTEGGVQFSQTTEEIARYAGEKYSSVGDYIRTAILTITAQTPIRPTAPAPTGTPATADAVDQAIFSKDIRQFVKDKAAIVAAMKALYSVVWGQCSETLQSKLKGDTDYNTTSADADSMSLY
jgi:hypothetical protein